MARRKTSFEIKSDAKIFSDPQFGLQNLASCLFHNPKEVYDAVFLLNFIKKNGGMAETDYKKYIKELCNKEKGAGKSSTPKTLDIEGCVMSWCHYQKILQTLRSGGLLDKRQGVYELSRNFSRYLNTAAECWNSFFES